MDPMRSLAPVLFALAASASAQIIDYHQHLYSPVAGAISVAGWQGVTADELISFMDESHVYRAVVLSTAYSLANPHKPPVPNEREAVRKDNDWTSVQVARHSDRLTGFCSVNPLKSYAIEEINRCAKDPNLRTGLKLHFGNSDVDVDNPAHVALLKLVFRAANRYRMAILVHAHSNVNLKRPYGAREARVFLEQLLPETPNVTVVLAHMAGADAFDQSTQQASAVYAEAIARHDPRVATFISMPAFLRTPPKLLCSRSAFAKSESPASSTAATLPSKVTSLPTLWCAGTRSPSPPKSSTPSKRTSPRFCGRPVVTGVEGWQCFGKHFDVRLILQVFESHTVVRRFKAVFSAHTA